MIGGALLTRYLLPLYPLVLLAVRLHLLPPRALLVGTGSAERGGFSHRLFVNPPYKFAPEDNLNYADVIRLHQQAIRQIVLHFPGSTVLTAWPATDELTKPELGYVKKPMPVVAIANFSLPEIQKAAASASGLQRRLRFLHQIRPSAAAAGSGCAQRGPGYTLLRLSSRSGAGRDRSPSGWHGLSGATSAKANGPRCCTSTARRWRACSDPYGCRADNHPAANSQNYNHCVVPSRLPMRTLLSGPRRCFAPQRAAWRRTLHPLLSSVRGRREALRRDAGTVAAGAAL